jgi:aminoglycoside 6'-N-acetyltransferase I
VKRKQPNNTPPIIQIRQLRAYESIPMDLLLLADPSEEMIRKYLISSEVYVADLEEKQIGVIALFPMSEGKLEIKNLAVKTEYQGKGKGTYMIGWATDYASRKGYKELYIGTANSSLEQLKLYQKLGFEVSSIKRNFFIIHYDEPIFENGIQAKHLIMLCKKLQTDI